MPLASHSRAFLVPFLPVFAWALAACGSSGGDDEESAFTVHSTTQACAGATTVAFSGTTSAYLASEGTTAAGGTDWNGDGDVTDAVLVLVDVATQVETNLGVAVDEFAWVGANLYLVVDESEGPDDWDGDGDQSADDLSLLHWTAGMADPVFIASLDGAASRQLVAVPGRLFFVEEQSGAPGVGLTTLQQIEEATPDLPLPVSTSSLAADGLHPRLLGSDELLVFAYADETVDAVDLDADGDANDELVLLLVDGTTASPVVHVAGLGLSGEEAARRANFRAAGDWLVAVLVSEAAHVGIGPLGGAFAGFNDPDLFDPAWQPPQCAAHQDTDTEDQVLFWIDFADWVTDPVGSPPQNTGLVGTDRVIALENHVATVSLESDDDGCDLNEDGDAEDRVVRWVETSLPVLPPFDSAVDLIALAETSAIPGGTAGLAELDGRIVILADEAADSNDIDDSGDDHRLLGWRHPDDSTTWTFNHGTMVGGSFVDFFGGATWMKESASRLRLLVAVPEDIEGVNLNSLGADTDTNDSVPAFLVFNSTPRLVFPFVRYATEADDPGILLAAGYAFYRISESADTTDWNADGDSSDHVLLRTFLDTGVTNYMGVASNVSRPAIDVDPLDPVPDGGTFVTSETSAGSDLNVDGDTGDFVLRWFKF